jgi:hypothetical protein
VAGIFHLIPLLGVLAFIAGLYGFTCSIRLPVLERCPRTVHRLHHRQCALRDRHGGRVGVGACAIGG